MLKSSYSSFRGALMGQKKSVVQGFYPGIQNISHATSTTTTVSATLNPFNEHDHDDISLDIISIHDGHHAVRQDVDSLFSVVFNIVSRSRSTNFTRSLDLKQVTIDLVEEKAADESALRPTYGLLKEIACQITCHSIDKSNAHESVVGVLKKLKDYTWDAKAVIALSAFALDCGQTWRLSFMEESDKKENAVEMHVFRLAEEDKNPAQSDSDFVDTTLKLIEGIIKLEKFFSNKSYNSSNVPTLSKAHRHVYTYWAVFSLFACANQVEPGMKNELVVRITSVLTQLTTYLSQINLEIATWEDLMWRTEAFHNPSVGIWQLLKALIYPKDVDHFEIIANNTSKVTMEDLTKTKYLFLFISGLDNIEDVIESLKSIYNSISIDGGKKDFQILWVPVVKTWSKEATEKFESFKSSMPWYVLHYPEPIHGYRVLVEEWDYQDKPIVVVADAFGKVLNKNALHLISLWGLEAFPYDPINPPVIVYQHWNWFWHVLFKIHSPIQTWVTSQDKYVFFYGGSTTWTEEVHTRLDKIKKDLGEKTNTYIEHYHLGMAEEKAQKRFWHNISHSLLSYSQNVDSTLLSEIQRLLTMRNQKGWAIVSKGKEVFLIGYNDVMLNVLKGFEEWQLNISESGFKGAIFNYYEQLLKPEDRPCMKFKLDNVHSRVLIPFRCPDNNCGRKMEICSVTYNCCHGMHHSSAAAAAADGDLAFENGKGPAYI